MKEIPDYKPKENKTKKLVDPKGHTILISIIGDYVSVIVYCDKCFKGYELTKTEIEQLPDV